MYPGEGADVLCGRIQWALWMSRWPVINGSNGRCHRTPGEPEYRRAARADAVRQVEDHRIIDSVAISQDRNHQRADEISKDRIATALLTAAQRIAVLRIYLAAQLADACDDISDVPAEELYDWFISWPVG